MNDHDAVRVEVTVGAPVDTVWRALRDPAEIRRWHGWDYDGLDAEIESIFVADVTVSEDDRTVDTGGGRFELEPRGEETVVRVAMPAPPEDPVWNGSFDEIEQGWLTFAQQLRFALERHPGEDRRTLYLAGDAREPSAAGPVEALGLAGPAALDAGGPYQAAIAVGETLEGRVWFQSEQQLGLTVDGWGDGLLVLTAKWEEVPPHGAAAAVVTTYGLDDAAFARLRERWTTWWAGHYLDSEEPQEE